MNTDFRFEIGKTYETQAGNQVEVLGRTDLKHYECLICSDGKHRYDRSDGWGLLDAGRVTGTEHDYSCPDNFKRNSLICYKKFSLGAANQFGGPKRLMSSNTSYNIRTAGVETPCVLIYEEGKFRMPEIKGAKLFAFENIVDCTQVGGSSGGGEWAIWEVEVLNPQPLRHYNSGGMRDAEDITEFWERLAKSPETIENNYGLGYMNTIVGDAIKPIRKIEWKPKVRYS